ncbi:FAD-dependent monooxygenase [Colwellia psychrerythraea]|uniref:Monooxygenase FAD-binding protein n=1 Tax=Colwellia psychrerythraea TaxID=28229 RepID=A0A099L572_COLPS|nr:FAD-dependent monooxygenase [Colwellia psychrerythraea]KGJ97565.1 monooxygenase FAD-binding protein [Colwellia psychrerythraea]
MKILIIGAGISGLTLALRLHKVGIDVEIFESVKKIKPLGAGINLLPHAVRELAAIDITDDLIKGGVETSHYNFYTPQGRQILSDVRGRNAGYDWPQLSIHRGLVQMVLLDKVKQVIGADKIHYSHHLKKYEQTASLVTIHCGDKDSVDNFKCYQGDAMIACDGIHSVVRKKMYPQGDELKYSGITMYRGMTYMKPYLDGKTMLSFGHWDLKLIVYPIDTKSEKPLVNWVAEVRGKKMIDKADWNKEAKAEDFIDDYSDWDIDFLDHNALFKNAEKIMEFPMVDRDALPSWSDNRITLLGDAAHPMYPIGSNGACQAILDVTAIVKHLDINRDNIAKAFKDYEQERIQPTSAVVASNRNLGPEYILEMVRQKCGTDNDNKCTCGDKAPQGYCISQDELRDSFESYKVVSGFTK